MGRRGKWMAGLLAGAASTALQAQGAAAPPAETAPASPPAPGDAAPAEPVKGEPVRKMEFRGPDGKPLPPEIQKQLEEQFKNNPPRAVGAGGVTGGPEGKDIVVTGQRPRGSVIGDIPPERTFTPLEIRAFGASNIGELIQSLGPQVSSNRGRGDGGPVVLLNGKRVSSYAEIMKIPTEAIERTEVFPEELALKYGYRADQKVVNVVTFERFNSKVGQLLLSVPTEGGRDTVGLNANYLRIQGNTRFNLDADYSRAGSLLESERDVLQVAGAPDLGRFRTLVPATERFSLNGTMSGNVLGDVSATLNGRFDMNESESLLGLGPNGALERETSTRVAHLGTALGGLMGKWLWSFTGNYDRVATTTLTDVAGAQGARDRARSVNSLANAEAVMSGSVFKLPAGPVSASFRAGGEMRDFSSRSLRSGVEQRADLSRDRGAVQASVDLPIASRREEVLAGLGNLSVNANLEIEELSDFGTLRTFGYGLFWTPIGAINLIASVTEEEGAPTVEQLGSPLIVTPNVRTLDFTRGEVVDITRVFGGNPNLRSDDRRVFRLGLNTKPFPKLDLNISVDYTSTRLDDPIASFPIATPEIEAAFPERFTRDAAGRLLRIDGRPLNFERSDQEQLRWGLNFTRPLGSLPPGMENASIRFMSAGSEADIRRRLPAGATMIRAEPGSPMANRMEGMLSRLIVSLYHTWHLEDEILVREGVPVLDLLNGSAVGNRGGRPRHELEFQAAAYRRGLGARLTANWQSGTTVNGLPSGPVGTAGDLSFSGFSTVNINLFADLGDRFRRAKAAKWLRGTRVSLGINNLFNSRPEVRDEAGLTPISYQPAYLDPIGRSVNFSIRKVF